MKILKTIVRTFNTFGLEKDQYALVRDRIFEDNRRKLLSATLLLSCFLMAMWVLSFFVENIAHNRNIFSTTTVLILAQSLLALAGKKYKKIAPFAVYNFMSIALFFGMYQGAVSAPEEQTASLLVLIVAVPVWFTMKPKNMIRFIYIMAAVYIACVLQVKTGRVQTSDIINTVVYSTAGAMISSYYSVIKAKRFYAEYMTERMSRTDMLTGLGNRAACTEDTDRCIANGIPGDLTILFLDVNKLKHINDTMGHHAGDELISGAAECIKKVFAQEGGCYRTGGDEFIVMGEFSEERFKELCGEFDRTVAGWKGNWAQELRISYGGAAAREVPGKDLTAITKLADKRLYEAKALYYSTKGIDRRGHQKAYRALCDSYIKILEVDLKRNICKVIRTDVGERTDASGNFSQWMEDFGNSGRVHTADLEEYRKKTDIQYLRDAFDSGINSVHIFYRRMLGDGFRTVMAEIVASSDYTAESPIVYLYVKDIERE